MAKINMKHIQLAATLEESKKIIDFLQFKGNVELKAPEEIDGLTAFSTDATVSKIEKYSDTAQSALKVLNKYVPSKSSLLAPLKGLPEMSLKEFIEKSDDCDKILGICYDICECEKNITESAAEVARLESAKSAVEPWLGLDIPMQFKGTKTATAYIGTLPDDYTAETLTNALIPLMSEDAGFECEIVSHQKERSCVFVLCENSSAEDMLTALRSLGFAYPADPTKHPPKVRYERLTNQIEKSKALAEESIEKIKSLAENREDIKFVYDAFSIRKDKYEALSKVCTGERIIFLEGYVPENKAEKLKKELEEKFTVALQIDEPSEDDDVPTMFENKPFAAAVEPITEMYSMPGKEDIDPNPVMAFFYYMLFGIMLSDAGYGLLMAIGCGIAKFGFKVKGKLKKTVDMYFWCGLATVFWGALFGSWFGDIVTRVASEFFGIANIGAVWNEALGFNLFKENIALWFEPVSNPTKLLLFSFLFGIVHLFFGVGASFVKMWKVNNKIGAFCDCIPVFLLIIGIAPIGANIIKAGCFDASITSVSKWLALAGAVLIVLTSGRDSKNIVGKLGLGLYGLYNAASGWLSDILSYSRLLALGLCTGVIATVINILGTIPEDKTTKAIMLVPVFILGHIVNMAINLIGTYVHTNRLQYVEFFAKFYEGGGRSFTPLKTNTKYFNIKEEK